MRKERDSGGKRESLCERRRNRARVDCRKREVTYRAKREVKKTLHVATVAFTVKKGQATHAERKREREKEKREADGKKEMVEGENREFRESCTARGSGPRPRLSSDV